MVCPNISLIPNATTLFFLPDISHCSYYLYEMLHSMAIMHWKNKK